LTYIILKSKQKLQYSNNSYKCALKVFLTGMKAKRDEGCRRMLLGDNTGGGAAMLQPIRFQHVEE
jgi:hypothetical protein